jgi:Domain of unknown function (DUF4276)
MGKKHFEKLVNHRKFLLFFAVHEIEAWFLSDASPFPKEFRKTIEIRARNPETVNFDTPPKALLKRLYRERIKREYKPVTQGLEFFSKLDPTVAASACPQLQAMLTEMLSLAQQAGV